MTASPDSADLREDSVGIVGVGLIGGSIAAALKARGYAGTIIGSGRDRSRLEAAREAGLLDEFTTDPPHASLVVVCTPVDRIAQDVRLAAAAASPGTLITDAGSVKGSIRRELDGAMPEGVAFIGAHPLAGSEKQGFEHASADLFVDALCVVVPSDEASLAHRKAGEPRPMRVVSADEGDPAQALARAERFWHSLGARTLRMTADEHDRSLARTSHLPHVAAAALVASLGASDFPFAATGFRDTTRIASGDPDLWTAILLANARPALDAIDTFRDRLDEFRTAIAAGQGGAVKKLLAQSKARRDEEPGRRP
ncbi:MAG: prephenate dehydrogenase/arogenate dehydrogenase family protein [Planctomycetaceae bacterium]